MLEERPTHLADLPRALIQLLEATGAGCDGGHEHGSNHGCQWGRWGGTFDRFVTGWRRLEGQGSREITDAWREMYTRTRCENVRRSWVRLSGQAGTEALLDLCAAELPTAHVSMRGAYFGALGRLGRADCLPQARDLLTPAPTPLRLPALGMVARLDPGSLPAALRAVARRAEARLMVVTNETYFFMAMSRICRHRIQGIRVDGVPEPDAFEAHLRTEPCDAVLCLAREPNVTASQRVEAVRRHTGRYIPSVVLSTDTENDRLELAPVSVDAIVSLPFELATIIDLLQILCATPDSGERVSPRSPAWDLLT
jgi:hypothetical protein